MAVLILNNRRSDKSRRSWIYFLTQIVQKKKRDCVDVRQGDALPSFRIQGPEVTQETCAYCSFYEFGWCTFHQKPIASDAEICNEIKQLNKR